MSFSAQTFNLPQGSARTAFDAAARAHQAARQTAVSQPVARSVAPPVTRSFEASAPASAAQPPVEGAIANAARQTGVDFDFLLAQARVESALDPAAKARTSSASGLYQFIESTWLDTLKRHGARFGLGAVADGITQTGTGGAKVADPSRRAEILALRHDPQTAALMAAGLAEDNAAYLLPILGRQPDHGELYLAHFLGAGGAGRFLSALQENPEQGAASLFAKAASANRSIFYERDGSQRSLAGVMSHLSGKIERAMGLAGSGASLAYTGQLQVSGASAYPASDGAAFQPFAVPVTPVGVSASLSAGLSAGASGTRLASAPQSRAPLSEVLNSAFAGAGDAGSGSPRAQAQVRRAYQQLKAFGL